MNNDNLRKVLEANRFYYAQIYESMRPAHERIRIEQKQILSGVYREVAEMEARLRAIEEEFGCKYGLYRPFYIRKDDDSGDASDNDGNDNGDDGSHYDPDEPRIPAGQPGGGQWTSGGAGDNSDLAQLMPLLEGPPVTPPFDALPEDPTVPPGPGWGWQGKGEPGSPQGNWYNPNTGESLHPDMDHPLPEGPHWDYRAPDNTWYRWNPDGTMTPKVVVSGMTA